MTFPHDPTYQEARDDAFAEREQKRQMMIRCLNNAEFGQPRCGHCAYCNPTLQPTDENP